MIGEQLRMLRIASKITQKELERMLKNRGYSTVV